jgi:hypothetical protein
MMVEYQELFGIKVALDMEISVYNKLLVSEEQRLNISNISTSHYCGGAAGASNLETPKAQTPSRIKKSIIDYLYCVGYIVFILHYIVLFNQSLVTDLN